MAEMTPDVTLLVNVPSGLPMTIAVWPGLRLPESPIGRDRQLGRVDLDDGQVGQRVDAVDGARQLAAVVELDRDLGRVGDDVAVGQDPAVRVEDRSRADAGRGQREGIGRLPQPER